MNQIDCTHYEVGLFDHHHDKAQMGICDGDDDDEKHICLT